MTGRPIGARLRRIPRPWATLKNHVLFRWLAPLRRRPLRPRALCLYVTYRCNLRCRTCGIWKGNREARRTELTLNEFDRILADKLFARVEFVNLNGGEPNLRTDLPEIAALVLRRFPRLHTLTLNTNGLPAQRTLENTAKIARLCRERRIKFSVSVSLHRTGPRFDEIAGIPSAYAKVMESLEGLRRLRAEAHFYLSVNCVASPLNIDALDDMVEWGRREGIPVNFTLGEVRARFNNLDSADSLFLDEPDRLRMVRFFRSQSRRKSEYWQHAIRYAELADMLETGKPRSLACHYALCGAIVGSDGTIYYCKKSRAIGNALDRPAASIYNDPDNLRYRSLDLFGEICPTCPPNSMIKIEAERDLGKVLRFMLKKGASS